MNMLRQTLAGLALLLAFTVVFGLGYPLLMTGIGQVAFHDQANGSMVQVQGKDVGSSLIGQEFKGAQWFQSRSSAGSYDALASGGTNLGPNSPDLLKAVQKARADIAPQDGVAAGRRTAGRGHLERLRARPPHQPGVRRPPGRPRREGPGDERGRRPAAGRRPHPGTHPRLPG